MLNREITVRVFGKPRGKGADCPEEQTPKGVMAMTKMGFLLPGSKIGFQSQDALRNELTPLEPWSKAQMGATVLALPRADHRISPTG